MKNFDTLFGDVRDNAVAAASAVSKQAAKIYDASKHRISAEGIKRNIVKKLIALGKLTYKATTQDVDLSGDIAKTVEEITELKQSLALINAHIASIKNQKICPECENSVPQYSVFCNICGHKFEAEEPVAEEEAPAEEAIAVTEDTVAAPAEEAAAVTEDAVAAPAEEAAAVIADAEEAETPAETEKAADAGDGEAPANE